VFNLPSEGIDTITDFTRGTDIIQITAAGFGSGLVADVSVTVVTAASSTAASNPGANGYFVFDNEGADAGTLLWDATGGNGDDAIAVLKLQGVTTLLPTDFHVV